MTEFPLARRSTSSTVDKMMPDGQTVHTMYVVRDGKVAWVIRTLAIMMAEMSLPCFGVSRATAELRRRY
jgi:hypothetical protein